MTSVRKWKPIGKTNGAKPEDRIDMITKLIYSETTEMFQLYLILYNIAGT